MFLIPMSNKQSYRYNKNYIPLTKEQKDQQREERFKTNIAKVLEKFQSGDLVDIVSYAFLKGNHTPSSKWSLNNKMIMIINDTNDARTFLQWKEVKRSV